jgi:hypothetical protein
VQDTEASLFKVSKSLSKPLTPGESQTISTNSSTAKVVCMQLPTSSAYELHVSHTNQQQQNAGASFVLPASLSTSLSIDTSVLDMAVYMSSGVAPVIGNVVPVSPFVSLTLSRSADTNALEVRDLPQGINITLPISNQSLAPPPGQVFAGYYRCVYWNGSAYSHVGCTSVKLAAPGTAQCTCNHLTGFAAIPEYEYPAQSFTLKNIGQSTQYTSALNTLTVSLQVSLDITGSQALPAHYTASGLPHKLIITGFGGISLGGTVALKAVSGGNDGHTLFCVGDTNRSAASANSSAGSMVLTLCADSTMTKYVTYIFAFDITNPSAPRPAAYLTISLAGSTALWPSASMLTPGGVYDPLYLVCIQICFR